MQRPLLVITLGISLAVFTARAEAHAKSPSAGSSPSSRRQSEPGDCSTYLSDPNVILLLQRVHELNVLEGQGKISRRQRLADLASLEKELNPSGDHRATKLITILQGLAVQEDHLRALRPILMRQLLRPDPLSADEVHTLELVGLGEKGALDRLIGLMRPLYAAMNRAGAHYDEASGDWDLSHLALSAKDLEKNAALLQALDVFTLGGQASRLLDPGRKETVWGTTHAFLPAQNGKIRVWTSDRYRRILDDYQKRFEAELTGYLQASKKGSSAIRSYLDHFNPLRLKYGLQKGEARAADVEKEGAWKRMNQIRASLETFGPPKGVMTQVDGFLQQALNRDNEGIQRLQANLKNLQWGGVAMAVVFPLIGATFLPPGVGAGTTGFAPWLGHASFNLLAISFGTRAALGIAAAGIDTSYHADGVRGLACRLLDEWEDRGLNGMAQSLVTVPAVALLPVTDAASRISDGIQAASIAYAAGADEKTILLAAGLASARLIRNTDEVVAYAATLSALWGLRQAAPECVQLMAQAYAARSEQGNTEYVKALFATAWKRCAELGFNAAQTKQTVATQLPGAGTD